MDVADLLRELGGVATRSSLVALAGRRAVDHALAVGAADVVARGRYAFPEVGDAITAAHRLTGALCLTSAALHHGWAVKSVPDHPHVAVPRTRNVPTEQRRGVHVHYLDQVPPTVCLDKAATLIHCLRRLPFDAALAVADSALRAGDEAALRAAAASARGPGSKQVRHVASLARVEAANPFESVLRAIALGVDGLQVEPQVLITTVRPWCRPDLADRSLGIAIEADSFEWHGRRGALARDARRYNLLVADGWLVLRFAWEHVMHDPDHVQAVLEAVVHQRAQPTLGPTSAA